MQSHKEYNDPIMYRLLFFALPLPFIAVCFVMIALNGIFGSIDPETIDRQTLIRVMQIRDFRQFSPELLERMTDRIEQEFGRHSPNRPTFEFPAWEKRLHTRFFENRSEQPSNMENNLTLMARIRYIQWMNDYQSGTLREGVELMREVVEEMRYWQEIYFDYLRFLGQPEPTLAELHEDFQRMIEAFKVGASPEEAEQIDSFARAMSVALFVAEAPVVPQTILDRIPPFLRR